MSNAWRLEATLGSPIGLGLDNSSTCLHLEVVVDIVHEHAVIKVVHDLLGVLHYLLLDLRLLLRMCLHLQVHLTALERALLE